MKWWPTLSGTLDVSPGMLLSSCGPPTQAHPVYRVLHDILGPIEYMGGTLDKHTLGLYGHPHEFCPCIDLLALRDDVFRSVHAHKTCPFVTFDDSVVP